MQFVTKQDILIPKGTTLTKMDDGSFQGGKILEGGTTVTVNIPENADAVENFLDEQAVPDAPVAVDPAPTADAVPQ